MSGRQHDWVPTYSFPFLTRSPSMSLYNPWIYIRRIKNHCNGIWCHNSSQTVCVYFSLHRPALSSFTGRDNMRQTHWSTSMRLSQNKWKENFKMGFIEISGLISCVFQSKWEEEDGKEKTHRLSFHSSLFLPFTTGLRALNLKFT